MHSRLAAPMVARVTGQADLAAARRGEGQTLFDIITSIIRAHGPGGIEAEDNVHLILA